MRRTKIAGRRRRLGRRSSAITGNAFRTLLNQDVYKKQGFEVHYSVSQQTLHCRHLIFEFCFGSIVATQKKPDLPHIFKARAAPPAALTHGEPAIRTQLFSGRPKIRAYSELQWILAEPLPNKRRFRCGQSNRELDRAQYVNRHLMTKKCHSHAHARVRSRNFSV